MNADVNVIYSSDFYNIIDFRCKCTDRCFSKTEFSKSFNISFVRKGNFIYRVFRNDFDAYNGYAIVDKPQSEHLVGHNHHIPDECTIIDFSEEFYFQLLERFRFATSSFFNNNDIQSLLIKTNSYVEYLHYSLYSEIKSNGAIKIHIDTIVFEILNWFLDRIDKKTTQKELKPKLKKNHLETIEKAKSYIFQNFMEDISLNDISAYCNISPFHFSRVFKTFSHQSPYQFLLDTRLSNAKKLIQTSNFTVKDIAYISGFQNIEHFSIAFKKRFKHSPSKFKKEQEF